MISQYFFILQFQDHIALIIHLPFGSRVFNKKVKIQKLFIRIKLLGAKKKYSSVFFGLFHLKKEDTRRIQSEFRSSEEGSLLLYNLFKVVTYMTDMNVKICQPTTWHLAKLLQLCTKWYFVSKIVLTYCEKKNILVIKKNFWNSRLQAENLVEQFIEEWRSVQFLKQNAFLTCSWRFLRSDT